MYSYIIPELKAQGFEGSVLECIIGNDRAVNLYKKIGFEIDRQLICYAGTIKEPAMPPEQVYWRELDNMDWAIAQTFWENIPSWQNSCEAVDRVSWSYRKLGIFKDNQLIGYGVINPLNGYVPQFGIDPSYRRQGLGKFLFSLLQSTTHRQLAIINIDHRSQTVPPFFDSLGIKETLRQFEMWFPFE